MSTAWAFPLMVSSVRIAILLIRLRLGIEDGTRRQRCRRAATILRRGVEVAPGLDFGESVVHCRTNRRRLEPCAGERLFGVREPQRPICHRTDPHGQAPAHAVVVE